MIHDLSLNAAATNIIQSAVAITSVTALQKEKKVADNSDFSPTKLQAICGTNAHLIFSRTHFLLLP